MRRSSRLLHCVSAKPSRKAASTVHECSGIRDPETGASVLARAKARALVAANTEGSTDSTKYVAASLRRGGQLPLQPLGWHSDYTPFLQHLGISTLDFGYGDGAPAGSYHSLYDSYDHYIRIVDPDFAYGVVLSETIGHVVLRLADSELLPLHFTEFAATVSHYLEEIEKLTDTLRERTTETNRLIDERAYELASPRHEPVGPPGREMPVPYVNFAPLRNAIADLTASARACDEAYAKAFAEPAQLTAAQRVEVNALLRASEQLLLSARGLPGRAWVPAPDLRAGPRDRIQRQDTSGCARGNRAASIRGSRRLRWSYRHRARGVSRADRPHHDRPSPKLTALLECSDYASPISTSRPLAAEPGNYFRSFLSWQPGHCRA